MSARPAHALPRPARAWPASRRLLIIGLVVVFALSLGARVWRLAQPAEYMFDEVYYAKDAQTILTGSVGPEAADLRWEPGDEVSWAHPEMGKFAVALGILAAGDRSLGWRLPSVTAGMLVLALVYPLARRLGLSRLWAFLALVFAAADLLGIAQSRIATLDVFVALWTVLCVYLALRFADGLRPVWLMLAGLAGGMALATKWSGLLALLAAVVVIAFKRWPGRRAESSAGEGDAAGAARLRILYDREREELATTDASPPAAVFFDDQADGVGEPGSSDDPAAGIEPAEVGSRSGIATATSQTRSRAGGVISALLLAVVSLVLLPAIVYFLSYVQYFAAGHTWADFTELHRQMWHFNTTLSAPHSYASAAWTWIVDKRPVWYYFNDRKGVYSGIVAMGNPFLWWTALAGLIGLPLTCLWRRTTQGLLPVALVLVLYLPWFATSRTSFLYYMAPVAPFLAILVAQWFSLLLGGAERWRGRAAGEGIVTFAAGFLLAAFASYPLGRGVELTFSGLAQHVGTGVAAAAALVVAAAVVAGVLLLARPHLARLGAWLLWAWAGAMTGIAVAFLPIVLGSPLPAEQFYRLMWFPSWI